MSVRNIPNNRFVIFSQREASASEDHAGFWSNGFGWTTLDCATTFPDTIGRLPSIGAPDATWMTQAEADSTLAIACEPEA